jgi:hypothetical protein
MGVQCGWDAMGVMGVGEMVYPNFMCLDAVGEVCCGDILTSS